MIGALAGGNLLAMALRMGGGLIQARLVDPAVLGYFASFALVLGYAPFLQLGIFNGLNREFPLFIGKGNPAHARNWPPWPKPGLSSSAAWFVPACWP